MKPFVLGIMLSMIASQALSDVAVRFFESAPKDRFEISSQDCATGPMRLTIDLGPSAGALIFDVTGSGAGVEVFQPFELISGASQVIEVPRVKDGDKVLVLGLTGLPPDMAVAFTIDLDDTVQSREITVTDGELTGAKVIIEADGMKSQSVFDATSMTVVPWSRCAS